jgi:hypothetical protein
VRGLGETIIGTTQKVDLFGLPMILVMVLAGNSILLIDESWQLIDLLIVSFPWVRREGYNYM